MAQNKLKLYVWEGVLADYTNGIAFAMAGTVEEARQAIYDKCEKEDGYVPSILKSDISGWPSVIVDGATEGFYIWGGG